MLELNEVNGTVDSMHVVCVHKPLLLLHNLLPFKLIITNISLQCYFVLLTYSVFTQQGFYAAKH